MIVLRRKMVYKQDPVSYLELSRFADIRPDIALIEGGFCKPTLWSVYGVSKDEIEVLKKKKLVRLEFEDPTKYAVFDYPYNYDRPFFKVFTLCPYTARWLNAKYGVSKYVPIFFPINEKYIPPKQQKRIDILYSGHIAHRELEADLKKISKFNYAIVSNSNNPLVTHKSVSHTQKMKLISQSRITLVHNLLFRPRFYHIISIWLSGDFWNNEAFRMIPRPWKPWEIFTRRTIHTPMVKSRLFEAALCRSLILCRRDEFNVIERFFTPEKEFVYYDPERLEETVEGILRHYSDYQPVIDRAYKRAIRQYTVKSFVNNYLVTL